MPPDWIERQLRRRGISDERVLAAMERVPREAFVPSGARRHAYADAALALSHGQSISQPYIVALICQALELAGDERVLDVGTGSGYQAAVLSELAAEVVSIERIPELAERARRTLQGAGYDVDVREGDGTLGVPERAPFDAIAVAASAAGVPEPLYEQLVLGGRLVLPIDESLVSVTRTASGRRARFLSPVRFVPLVSGLPDQGPGMTGPS
ncbi:MAG TPA: protein-L-isoaspartate(D-aspartate) O-methyltransferase [Gaiellaceae bacterium]|nr:protein-L-isoaspartate(D-aspartate) O-methyltransferase [Gaiellaceae bacterium]